MRTDLSTKLRDMHALAADSCDPEFNRALIEASEDIERRAQDRGDCQVAMDCQQSEIERLRAALEVSESVNRTKTELLIDVVALLADTDCTPLQRLTNARTAIAVRTGPPRTKGATVDLRD